MLKTYHHISSIKGLSSITTLITSANSQSAILIDPPFLIPDAHSVIAWIHATSPNADLKAIFVTHHHPDHFFSANPILDAYPAAKFYAAPYVLAGIEREYAEKVAYWPSVLGAENVPATPRKPEPFPFSFFLLEDEGDDEPANSPIVLLGPLQGDAIDHTVFWLPRERTVICGDTVYGRSTHVWVEEVENPALLEAWRKTLDLITHLHPTKLIPGHLERGWELNCAEDLAHTRRYLDLFAERVTYAPEKPQVQELYDFFRDEFPQCRENLDFFLGHMANQFGEGGTVWEENRHQDVAKRTLGGLCGYWFK
ncbi:MBL fold metallo-hydrolase [Aspergillus homomorphus CBS 101889]|uniref:Putative metallo-beta-lactamase domain protein n=1 Tax=Aspergillus homomorphus (strain CBS 101889) TaxID=1450537 RepID=A0A395IDG1_ASPHC|nr:putative metallo-beta-lactamase domain protein [Aspergillus homomorphus CBS 101889]RAL17193.1 putative metallo-beta-lactamase domain protein [Aspergillus homomorphus CBS 101889]